MAKKSETKSSDAGVSPPAPQPQTLVAQTPGEPTIRQARDTKTSSLRARIQESVLEFTTLKRKEQIANGVDPKRAIEITEEYDPVVAMAICAVATGDPDLHDKVAKYIQPTLKSVEVVTDEQRAADNMKRSELGRGLMDHLKRMQQRARANYEAEHPGHAAPKPVNQSAEG